ncbi:hypothetical protein WJX82_005176 [Trebouxia sp. C0006]
MPRPGFSSLQKKGPDSWQVEVQMYTPSAGTHHCVLGVMLDIFWRVNNPSAPSAKRVRSDSFGQDSSSQPTVHYSTVSTEDVTQRLQSLEVKFTGMHVKLQSHDDKLDRLHGQMGDHTEDLEHVQVELATRAMPGAAENLQSCSGNIHHPVGNSSPPSLYGQSASNQADASHTPVTLPHPSPHHRAPTPHTPCSASTHTPCSATTYTPCSASTVSCPPFNGSLTRAELRPAMLRALEIHKPNSQSALDLSKMLWPENTPMRKAVNTMVKGVLYSDEMASEVERNGTHWALKC